MKFQSGPSIVALVILATGCAGNKIYEPIPQQGVITRSVTWVITDNPGEACDRVAGKALIGTRHACAQLQGNQCTIYVRPPKGEHDRTAIYILGHEALHCFVGQYHYALN